jgi:hypothetical protein
VIRLVDRVPGPAWLVYALATLVFIGAFVVPRALLGIELNPVTIGYTAFTVLPIAAMHYANRAAARALRQFRPALGELEPRFEAIERRLTTMPFATAIVAAVVGATVLGVGQLTAGELWGIRPGNPVAINVVTVAMQLILNAGFAAFVFHTIVQVREITRLHRDATALELWDTPPHKAFSNLTLVLAVAIVLPYTAVEIISALRSQLIPFELAIYVAAMVLAVGLFVLPLIGVRARLLHERTRQLDESNRVSAAVASRLRGAAEAGDLSQSAALNDTLAGLALEQDRLRRVSAWPWTAATLRGFITTLGIPLALWFLTTLLGRVLF